MAEHQHAASHSAGEGGLRRRRAFGQLRGGAWLLRLGKITDQRAIDMAEALLLFGDNLANTPAVPYLLQALDFLVNEPRRAVITGEPDSTGARDLIAAAHGVYQPNKVILGVAEPVEKFAKELPVEKTSAVYLCTGTACQEPTSNAPTTRNDGIKNIALIVRCVVTAGPTYEPIDEVRRLTNHSTGQTAPAWPSLGQRGARGDPAARRAGHPHGQLEGVATETFTTTADLAEKLGNLAKQQPEVGAVFHAAAVSDFAARAVLQKRRRQTHAAPAGQGQHP